CTHCRYLRSPTPCHARSALFCFVILVRPPRSTRFPYTTLFRSGLMDIQLHPDYENNGWLYFTYAAYGPGGKSEGGNTALMRARLDRKSTRLNSSHVKISYAVFCLKKKTRHTCLRNDRSR